MLIDILSMVFVLEINSYVYVFPHFITDRKLEEESKKDQEAPNLRFILGIILENS